MNLKTGGRNLCSTEDAAKIYGCTTGRIRQLARAGAIWSHHFSAHMVALDLDEITRKAKEQPATGRPRSGAKLKRA